MLALRAVIVYVYVHAAAGRLIVQTRDRGPRHRHRQTPVTLSDCLVVSSHPRMCPIRADTREVRQDNETNLVTYGHRQTEHTKNA